MRSPSRLNDKLSIICIIVESSFCVVIFDRIKFEASKSVSLEFDSIDFRNDRNRTISFRRLYLTERNSRRRRTYYPETFSSVGKKVSRTVSTILARSLVS